MGQRHFKRLFPFPKGVLRFYCMKYFIAIAGNIGAGKSNLATKLAERLRWQLYQEPFQVNPYLENFYEDMGRWSFHCEVSFLSLRLNNHLEILKEEDSVIQDRCLYEGAEVFVKNLYHNSHLSQTDWETYNNLYQTACTLIKPPDLLIYIQSSPERCLNNIKRRARDMEWGIDETYIRDLNKLYNDWIDHFKLCPVLRANADTHDFKYNETDFQKLLEQLRRKLKFSELPLKFP